MINRLRQQRDQNHKQQKYILPDVWLSSIFLEDNRLRRKSKRVRQKPEKKKKTSLKPKKVEG